MSISIELTETCREELKKADPFLSQCLFKNYIGPIQAGKNINELEGRFKPSWEVIGNGTMRDLFVKQAKESNLHHYHIGYKYYKASKDQAYYGKVSDGIVHIVISQNAETNKTIHRLIKVSEHHKPFSLPMLYI